MQNNAVTTNIAIPQHSHELDFWTIQTFFRIEFLKLYPKEKKLNFRWSGWEHVKTKDRTPRFLFIVLVM
jgi:hypothetical protein